MAIAGIPSTVNDFSAGPFMQNYYHSQYDNQDVYQEAVYQFHHECYLKLIMAIDRLVLPPMNFSNTMNAVAESIHENALSFADPERNRPLTVSVIVVNLLPVLCTNYHFPWYVVISLFIAGNIAVPGSGNVF